MLGDSLSLTKVKPQLLQREVCPDTQLSGLVSACRASLEGAAPEDSSHFPDNGKISEEEEILSQGHRTGKSLGK